MPGKIHDSEKNKAYKRYVILSEEEEESRRDPVNILICIGKQEERFLFLKTHYEQIRFARTPQEAIPLLITADSGQPMAVISDTSSYLTSIRTLLTNRGKDEILLSIPLLLMEQHPVNAAVHADSSERKIDEVILTDQLSSQQIADKIAFWIKLKTTIHLFNQEKKIILPDLYSQGSIPSWGRMVDMVIATVGLIMAIPFMAVIALLIKLDSPGPVFYIAPRAGRGYRIFSFFKFRTMVVGADNQQLSLMEQNEYVLEGSDGAVFFKMKEDPRSTRLGKWLRKTSLDELPQLFNVLRGDIALIGNRPLPLREACTLTTDAWSGRFLPPAGIVSLWHIQKSDIQKPTVKERMHYDLLYAQKQQFLLDLWILLKTPWWVLGMKNR